MPSRWAAASYKQDSNFTSRVNTKKSQLPLLKLHLFKKPSCPQVNSTHLPPDRSVLVMSHHLQDDISPFGRQFLHCLNGLVSRLHSHGGSKCPSGSQSSPKFQRFHGDDVPPVERPFLGGHEIYGCFPKNRGKTPQNGWFIMEKPIKMDDLGVPLFSETSIYDIKAKNNFKHYFLSREFC